MREFAEHPGCSLTLTDIGGSYRIGHSVTVRHHYDVFEFYLRAEPSPEANADAEEVVSVLDALLKGGAFTLKTPGTLRYFKGYG